MYFRKEMKVLVQGATGREGQRAVGYMKDYFTNVVAGVTPGKGGQAVLDIPIFNSVEEAVKNVGKIDVSTLYVPPLNIKDAVQEALGGDISFIHILTEGIPYRDITDIIRLCRLKNAILLGPSSLGIIVTQEGRIGLLGGVNADQVYLPGDVSIISRSGGMTNEIANYLFLNSIGIRMAVHLGADVFSGISLVEQIKILEEDKGTKIILVFEELTHGAIYRLLEFLRSNSVTKKIILCLVGKSYSIIPQGASFGHIDALLKKATLSYETLVDEFEKVGVGVVQSYEEFIQKIKS